MKSSSIEKLERQEMVLTFQMKKILSLLCLLLLLTGRMGVSVLWADPLEKLGPDQSIYQRVRNLAHAGLLDTRDQSVLDQGVPLTRLQLAFYVEKARTRLQSPPPVTPKPTATDVDTPTFVPTVETPVPTPVKKSKAKVKRVVVPTKKKTKKAASAAVTPVAEVQQAVVGTAQVSTQPVVTEQSTPVAEATQEPTAVPAVTEVPTEVPTSVPVATEIPTAIPAVIEVATPVPTVAVDTPVPTTAATVAMEAPLVAPEAAKPASDLIEPPPEPVVSKGTEPTYIWQEGDDMKSVAKKLYGNPDMSKLLEDANKDLMDQPDALKVGRVLKVPPAPAPAVPAAAAPETSVQNLPSDRLKNEIQDLLKELRQEDALLKNRLKGDERLVAKRNAELDKVKPTLEEWDKVYRKSDKSSGSNHLDIMTNAHFENIQVAGVTAVNAYRATEEFKMGFYGDLNGKGTFSTGMGGVLPTTNATAAPASIYIYNPKLTYNLDGKLGHWENTLTIEDFLGETDLGTFTRGQDGSTRNEKPFEIKNYSDDNSRKCWDDYINNLGYVASVQMFTSGNPSDRVFDGLVMKGSRLPLVGKDATLALLIGPLTAPYRWEEGGKFSRTWVHDKVSTSLSTLWVNDHYGIHTNPSLDLKTYQAEIGLAFLPVFVDFEGAASGMKTGVDTQATGAIKTLWDKALQATMTYYPLGFYGQWVGEDFSNYESKATITGIDYTRYGYTSATTPNEFGYVGLSDSLISNRYGGRINLGWKGRQSAWMKSWPKFLDAIIVNADAALRREERSAMDPTLGRPTLTADWLVNVYTPDGTGTWGNDVWGAYASPRPVGTTYFQNITDLRTGPSHLPSLSLGTLEWIPLMLPVLGSDGLPVRDATGNIIYTNLTHQKTYQYLTGTMKVQFNKWFDVSRPIYGGFYFTDNKVSGTTSDATLAVMADPNRPGQTLSKIPNLFEQRSYDAALMVRALTNVEVMGDLGLERWTSQYTYPLMDRTTHSIGAGLGYDFPWGGSKFEIRYKHLRFEDAHVLKNNFKVDQTYATFVFKF